MYGHQYTPEEKAFICTFAPGHTYQQIMDEYNKRFSPGITVSRVKGFLGNNRLSTGTTGRFAKGHTPANKGTHIGGWEPTQFKKGQMPVNIKPVGTETVRSDGYVWVKIAEPNKWREKHRLEWEKHNGSIPRGKCIMFLDGNSQNVTIDNLTLIDRRVNVRLNQMGFVCTDDRERTTAAIGVAELMSAIGEAKRKRR